MSVYVTLESDRLILQDLRNLRLDWRGVEQKGRRPLLVVQNDVGNRSSPATVVASISSAVVKKAYPFVVLLAEGEAGLPKAGFNDQGD